MGITNIYAQNENDNWTRYVNDSIQCDKEVLSRENPIPMYVLTPDSVTGIRLYAEPNTYSKSVEYFPENTLFFQGEAGDFWACSYLGYTAYIKKTDADNTNLLQSLVNKLSRHFLYVNAYYAWETGLKIRTEYMEEWVDFLNEEKKHLREDTNGQQAIEMPTYLQHFRTLDFEGFKDGGEFFDKLDPKVYFHVN
ncbi:hypothetical protein C7Y71_008035 [Pseudoprevotella muciniphila]|uniref:Uncharacterized protein n=2 Tax=Pseudoprevotella muciniphila TaxID=2133944 RepID=A0A5P8E7K1_9BACT|nr:hypothetical protein C7Y71_008035 [Pseudoprevotella muciniphila]